MYRRFCTKAAACAMSLMMAGGVSVITSENSNIKNVSASSTYYRYVTASSLNVRSGASTRYSRVGSYKKGTKVTCYGTSGSWTKVRYGGKTRYVSSQYLSAKKPGSSTSSSSTSTSAYSRYVTASSLNIRSKASTSSSKVGSYKKGSKVSCYGKSGSWTKVKHSGKTRYVSSQYLSTKKPGSSASSSSTSSSSKGQQIANYAQQFVGNPYRYGGTSLTKGADCSGFTQSVYKHFGYSIPRTSSSQRSAGKKVSWSQRKAGDLICYSGHVAIYIGNNKIVHASNAKDGIKITSPANYRTVLSVRRIAN